MFYIFRFFLVFSLKRHCIGFFGNAVVCGLPVWTCSPQKGGDFPHFDKNGFFGGGGELLLTQKIEKYLWFEKVLLVEFQTVPTDFEKWFCLLFLLSLYEGTFFKFSYKSLGCLGLTFTRSKWTTDTLEKVWNIFKVNNKNTRMTSTTSFRCFYC